ncbi:MAG: hypothetical protein JW976_14680 [Syntrophaceae bacterium]|nr:hypothetical protein [Syntrophaceae bacterium]
MLLGVACLCFAAVSRALCGIVNASEFEPQKKSINDSLFESSYAAKIFSPVF